VGSVRGRVVGCRRIPAAVWEGGLGSCLDEAGRVLDRGGQQVSSSSDACGEGWRGRALLYMQGVARFAAAF
jgi:hypothetical protein